MHGLCQVAGQLKLKHLKHLIHLVHAAPCAPWAPFAAGSRHKDQPTCCQHEKVTQCDQRSACANRGPSPFALGCQKWCKHRHSYSTFKHSVRVCQELEHVTTVSWWLAKKPSLCSSNAFSNKIVALRQRRRNPNPASEHEICGCE